MSVVCFCVCCFAFVLQEQDCQNPLQKLQLLIAALRHESVAVRHVGLGEVRNFLLQYKTFMGDAMTGLLSCSGPAAPPGGPCYTYTDSTFARLRALHMQFCEVSCVL